MRLLHFVVSAVLASLSPAAAATEWTAVGPSALQDDDLARHAADPEYLKDIVISELRFSENGFDWQLLQFAIPETASSGPLWVVPHDDEDVAFDSMIAALRSHGGVGVVVNTGGIGTRRQEGYGYCGVRTTISHACDPNRNFDDRSPLFTSHILRLMRTGRPVIALHSNSPGFSGDGKAGRGDITMLDAVAYRRGVRKARVDGYFGSKGSANLADPDVYAILPYRAEEGVSDRDLACRVAMNKAGVNIWHERVGQSDGSLSNYIALNLPGVGYVNFEAKREKDLSTGADAQRLMIAAYLQNCTERLSSDLTKFSTGFIQHMQTAIGNSKNRAMQF